MSHPETDVTCRLTWRQVANINWHLGNVMGALAGLRHSALGPHHMQAISDAEEACRAVLDELHKGTG